MFDLKILFNSSSLQCGAICLEMLLNYNNIFPEKNLILKQCNVREIGCTFFNLQSAASYFNLNTEIYTLSAEEIFNLKKPAILEWQFNHYVVYGGLDKETNKVVLFDPCRGRFKLSKDTFSKLFSGTVLL